MKNQASNSMTPPLVSVLIPAYNCGQYIETAVRSILDQTYTNLEVIVIDDGSTDDTWEKVIALSKIDPRMRPLKNEHNLKIVGTLNRGISESRGVYIARMDGDDFREPASIQQQVAHFEEYPDVVLVGGEIDVCDGDMNVINHRVYPHTDAEIRSKLFRYNPFAHPSTMMRASALKHEAYELNWAEDYDLWFRLGNKGTMANLDSTVLKLRTHTASVSQSKVSHQEYLTLYIRLRAVFEYGYTMTTVDKLYFATQLLSKWLMPVRFRFWLFNKLRGSKA